MLQVFLARCIDTLLKQGAWIAAFNLLSGLTVCLGQTPISDRVPRLNIEGTGRVCWGHLRVSQERIRWTTPFNKCDSKYQVALHQGTRWVLKVDRGAKCAFAAIEIERPDPNSYWSVTGYQDQETIGKPFNGTELSCLMD